LFAIRVYRPRPRIRALRAGVSGTNDTPRAWREPLPFSISNVTTL
jgi:hypothetical protein